MKGTSPKNFISLVDSSRLFLKKFEKTSKCSQILLQKPKIEIGYTKSKINLFAHFYTDVIEHPERQFRLSSRFGNINSSAFSIKKFELDGNQFILTEIVNFNHRKILHLYDKRYYVANRYEISESIYVV